MAAVLLLGSLLLLGPSTVLYAIDFNTQEVDAPPRVHGEEFPRDSVTEMRGRPEVVREMGPLTSQPLRLDFDGQVMHVEGILLNLRDIPRSFEQIEVNFDLYIESLAPSLPSGRGSGFAMLYFSDAMSALRFQSDGRLIIDYFDAEPDRHEVAESKYSLGSKMHVRVLMDRRAETFCASIDESPQPCVRLGTAPPLEIGFAIQSINAPGAVAIDDIEVIAAGDLSN